MYWWQYILFPFALLFDLITKFRNFLFDRQIKKSTEFDANIVLIGNLAIGGTGKTPMVDFLIRYFHVNGKKVATMSRGYGRKTYGFRLAGPVENSDTLGDEPYMYHDKYKGAVAVAVGGDRDLAIAELLARKPETEVILMDDGFQNRGVKPSISIVLSTYDNIFTKDFVLPSGRLRESRIGAKRADVVIVTKCPEHLNDADMARIRMEISAYTEAQIFFMATIYEPLLPIFENNLPQHSKVVAISGMAYPEPFEKYLRSKYSVKLAHNYRDHYRYSLQDVKDIARELKEGISMICTEKDKVKLQSFASLKEHSCYYQPISMRFLRDEALFFELLESKLIFDVEETI
ncbi:MAG: tetraacyldisaccharide 4'-kinase [Marinoscillum sp.]|jgi:tetraacyldisaccharide 4'-kinase